MRIGTTEVTVLGWALRATIACAVTALTACGSRSGTTTSDAGSAAPPPTGLAATSQVMASAFVAAGIEPGVTPFIAFVNLVGSTTQNLADVEFTVTPKSGSVSRPVHVRYSMTALARQGYVQQFGGGGLPSEPGSLVILPVFGLYAGFANQVSVQLDFQDGSATALTISIPTPAYTDPNDIYDHRIILKQRAPGAALGFDFFVMKSLLGTPVIVDTDGEIRWVGADIRSAEASAVVGNGFLIGDLYSPALYQLGFDGLISQGSLPNPPYIDFHHNIDNGKQGLLAEVNSSDGSTENVESVVVELSPNGSILKTWDLAAILSAYMTSHGDDASAFVRPGVDWFHMNATTYDPSDDSLIVSSREDFLIKLDYSTENILWILGDPTKYWHTFPSLRAMALTLQPGGLYPIGQHAVSITPDGLVMVFNDGLQSLNQPVGASAGQSRTYSAVSAYSIDPVNRTAQEVWRFDYGQTIFSPICSSAYEVPEGSVLVDYATAANFTQARLVGLDRAHNIVFDFEYPSKACNTSWNATPIALDDYALM